MNSNGFNYQTSSINLNFGIFPNTKMQQDVELNDVDSSPRKRSGRRKIKTEYIEDITFTKKKAYIIKRY